jgi:hypothetical protein
MNEALAAEKYQSSSKKLKRESSKINDLVNQPINDVITISDSDFMKLDEELDQVIHDANDRKAITEPSQYADIDAIDYSVDKPGESEITWMQSSVDLRGLPLKEGESEAAYEALSRVNDHHRDDANDSTPSPLQERLMQTLAYDPNISQDTQAALAHDADTMRYGARTLVNSPFVTDDHKREAFNTSPASALESPSLPGDCANQMLTSDNPYTRNGQPVDHQAVLNALHHPNADPKMIYDYVRANNDDDQAKWAVSLNPNESVIEAVHDYDVEDNGTDTIIVDDPKNDDTSEWHDFLD